MKRISLPFIALSALILFFILSSSLFIVRQTEQALVLQFGEFVKAHTTPGLKFKIPLIQEVYKYDRRLLKYNLPVTEIITKGNERLVVDLYVRFKINDVLTLFKAARTVEGVKERLDRIVISKMQEVMGRTELPVMFSEARAGIMNQIFKLVRDTASSLGLEVVDLRIIRADYPKSTLEKVFERMRSEMNQQAELYLSEGAEAAQIIRAKAEKDRAVLLAEARKKAEELRGEGDAKATEIYGRAFGANPDFFQFYRSLQAYKDALGPEDTTLILSPKSEFLKFLNTK